MLFYNIDSHIFKRYIKTHEQFSRAIAAKKLVQRLMQDDYDQRRVSRDK